MTLASSRGVGLGWGEPPPLVPPETPLSQSGKSDTRGPLASVGAFTVANFGKGGKNQDSFVASTNPSGSKSFVGVFDGHGEQGGRMSQYVSRELTKQLFENKELHSDPASALEDAYKETHSKIVRDKGFQAEYSGTTAVAAYHHRNKLLVANVGDSRAVLGRCDDSTSKEQSSKLVAVDLSIDQKPSRSDEKQRILAQGGIVRQGVFPMRSPAGGVTFVRAGPERICDKGGQGGLAVSRSFGDLALHPYVTAQPEMCERRLSSRDKVVILGSDGVWDHVSSQEAVDIAGDHSDPNAAAREIADVARKRWAARTEGCLSDDITAVVMHLDHQSQAGRGSSRESRDERPLFAQRRRPMSKGGVASPAHRSRSLTSGSDFAKRQSSDRPMRSSSGFHGRMVPVPECGLLGLGQSRGASHLLPPAGRRTLF